MGLWELLSTARWDWLVFWTAIIAIGTVALVLVTIIQYRRSKREGDQIKPSIDHPDSNYSPPPQPPQAELPEGFNNLVEAGQRRNRQFTGRDDVLAQIERTFLDGGILSLTQALSGLGGVGKTSIALEYFCRHRRNYTCRWWINAETEEGIVTAYRLLATKMRITVPDASPDEVVTTVRGWLQAHDNWLLVFDNAEPSFPVKGDAPAKTLRDYLPEQDGERQHILITSRYIHWHGLAEPVKVDVFTKDEVKEFLRKIISLPEGEDQENLAGELAAQEELATELGCLPLALTQAAAYIAENQCGYRTYLRRFRRYRLALLAKKTDSLLLTPKDTVNLTWTISIRKIEDKDISARQLLNCCAFLAPDNIQLGWFTQGRTHLPPPLRDDLSDEDELRRDRMVTTLCQYSLVARAGDGISLHRLVQEVIRDALAGQQQDRYRDYCLAVLHECRFFDFSAPEWRREFEQILPHIKVVISHGETKNYKVLVGLYDFVGKGFQQSAAYSEALVWYGESLAIEENVFGLKHPDTTASYSNIGGVYYIQGDYAKALEFHEKALAIDEKIFGMEHLSIAGIYYNIGKVYYAQSDYAKALEFYEKALAIYEKILGLEHPHTATVYNGIAEVYRAQNDYSQALKFCKKGLDIREKVLGREHPNTADSYDNIAFLYEAQGKHEQALALWLAAYRIRRLKLGETHPDTKDVFSNLQHAYEKTTTRNPSPIGYGKLSATDHCRGGSRTAPTC